MDIDELRGIELFAGLTDDQLAELATGGRRGAVRRRATMLFTEGEPADELVGAGRGSLDLVRQVGREESCRPDGRSRSLGRRLPRLGPRRESTSPPVAERRRSRAPARRPRYASWSTHWFPLAGHLIGGFYQHGPLDRQRPSGSAIAGRARHAGGRAGPRDQQPGGGGHPRRRRRSGRRCDALLDVADPAGRATTSRPSQFIALDALRREIDRVPAPSTRSTLADRESDARRLARRARRGRAVGNRARTLAAGGIDDDWCERADVVLGTGRSSPGLEWVAATIRRARPCSAS